MPTHDDRRAKRRRGIKKRLPFWGLLLLLGVSLAMTGKEHPLADLQVVVAEVERTRGAGLFYEHRWAAVGFFPEHGFTVALSVGGIEDFAPAEYLVLLQVDGALQGEMIVGEGPEGVRPLTDADLQELLRTTELDLSPVERVFQAYYAAPRGRARASVPESVAGPAVDEGAHGGEPDDAPQDGQLGLPAGEHPQGEPEQGPEERARSSGA